MKFMIKAGLAAGLWLLVADAATGQIVVSPAGDELLVPSAKDQKCFENKLLQTVADESLDPREVIFDCEGGALSRLGANRRPSEGDSAPPPPPRRRPFAMLLTPQLASCILAHWKPARLLALTLAFLSSPCPHTGR